ncbi:DEAD/DEAH box helicase [Georgenia sp. AZ-5]|uniref:DEAD/DEAH box helicase n=1 Tax=Georgenia sp. AZ-5 TaxID=3367526 RepID=UPI0037546067
MPATAALNLVLDDLLPEAEDSAAAPPGPDEIYEAFGSWAADTGITLYPHQEEAVMELVSGSHVILATPTGSGKSLVAMGALFTALATGRTGYYTAPLKALVSEKFFDLVDLFGSANVGMVTGDSAINPDAPIICCTAEILANQALRDGGPGAGADALVCMDEFHFYADPQRGWAWQVPLLELPGAQFLLMSATLGDVSFFVKDLERRTVKDVAVVDDAERPVPLTYSYSVEPIQDLLLELLQTHRAPVYVVHFAQKDAVERAQSLTSVQVASREQRDRVAAAIGDFRFGPGFGAILSRLLRHGVGVHHAGMLPRYRRLVERLTQQGLLGVICGTDTLGVGINVPIRTVVITSLTKFDGERSRHLTAREFHQIAGRAGRAGFDTTGEVIVQAPEHVIENAKALAKAGDDERKRRKIVRKKAPAGVVNWTDKTFERLRDAAPEPLSSQFRVTHTMVLSVMGRPGDPVRSMYRLLTDNHEPRTDRNLHLRRTIEIYRSLRAAGVVEHADAAWRRAHPGQPYVRLTVDLPRDFALNAPLSPFALAAMELLDRESPDFALDVVSVIEATLEDPRPLLYAQQRQLKGEAVGAMKAEGLEYDERMALLEDVTWPRPLAELLEGALATYRQANPWVADYELQPKSVVREMVEQAMTFSELVSRYQLARSEGVVLRYLTDAYRALRQVVPDWARTDEVAAIVDWLGNLVRSVDSSLLDEWEALAAGAAAAAGAVAVFDDVAPTATERRFGADEDGHVALTRNRHAFRVAVRNALFRRVDLLAREAYEALGNLDGDAGWDAARWERAVAPYWDEYDWLGTGPEARAASLVEIAERPADADLPAALAGTTLADLASGSRVWLARQTFDDPDGDHDWGITALVDLDASDVADAVVLRVLDVGPR